MKAVADASPARAAAARAAETAPTIKLRRINIDALYRERERARAVWFAPRALVVSSSEGCIDPFVVRGAGKFPGRSGASSWNKGCGSGRPWSRCAPRLRKLTLRGADASTARTASPESRI